MFRRQDFIILEPLFIREHIKSYMPIVLSEQIKNLAGLHILDLFHA